MDRSVPARGGRRPRSQAMVSARRMFAVHERSEREGIPPAEVLGALEAERASEPARPPAARHTRRELLIGAGGVVAGAALSDSAAAALTRRRAGTSAGPRIAIVGAGLAGLRCAHMLWTQSPRAPVRSTVYEANPSRAGGRCWTLRGFFAGGLITEHGGAFLDSNQTAVRQLATRLGLKQEIVNGGDLPQGDDAYFIGGRLYTYAEANADWHQIGLRAFTAAAQQMQSPRGQARLDRMSVPEWLDSTGIGSGSRLGKLMMSNAVTENGADPAEQSALDLIVLLTANPPSALSLLPGNDERFHVVGGNDQLVSRMIGQLPPTTVRHDHVLVAVRERADRRIGLVFDVSGRTVQTTADLVVLALPFSTLRRVELKHSGLSATKRRVIRTMGMGTNAKIHIELSHKTWPVLGYAGVAYGEWQRLACAWDDSVPLGPNASPALWLAYPGGRVGRTGITGNAHGRAPARDVSWALTEIEPVFPGTTAAYTGRAYEDHWARDPWVHGAYSYYRVGQAASYGALAARSEGRFLFAGEHTSINNMGFLDGAVETGERCARALLRRLRL
ncbi:MAG TPA: NAD(P)/FAD-dependent oxidoreductase [Solirubrobacteraceae bacterium]